MSNICKIPAVFFLLNLYLLSSFSFAESTENVLVSLPSVDPAEASTLGSDDLLYVLVDYKSDIPLRFQAIATRSDSVLEVGAIKNPGARPAPGNGEALVWVGYSNPTHIDAVRVMVMDQAWQTLYTIEKKADIRWQGVAAAEPRKPAEWVDKLIRAEQRKSDYFYDPSPKKFGLVYDIVFFLTMVSVPAYILLQLHMLWRYRYRWRELAMIPIFPYLILAFYVAVGLDIEESLTVTFLFRYTPMALLYLVALWLAKRFWQNKLPPPKLYKPPNV